jgi:hypothetical protein
MDRVPQLTVELGSLRSNAKSLLCGIFTSLGTGVVSGIFSSSGNPFCITGASISLATLIGSSIAMGRNIRRQGVIEDLINRIEAEADMPIEEFVRQNPMAQLRLDEARNMITITNPDGSTMVGVKEEVPTQEAEELPSEPASAGAGTGLPRARIRNIQDLPRSVGGYARNGSHSGESKSEE